MLPRDILVPVDFSEGSEHALDYAIELAGKLDARVHLLNAIGVPTFGYEEIGVAIMSTVIEDLVRSNQDALDKVAAARQPTALIGEVILRTGDARDVILQTVDELAIDLVVMGTHGRHGLRRALMGSVAESVVRTAPCPVLTVHP